MSYQPPPQWNYHPAPPNNGLGVTSMVLGILGLIFSFIPFIGVIAWPLVILGIIFGGVGINKAGQVPGMPKGTAIAGLTCSLIGLVICILWVAVWTPLPFLL